MIEVRVRSTRSQQDSGFRSVPSQDSGVLHPDPIVAAVALLTDDQIKAMSREDLIDLIRMSNSRGPTRNDVDYLRDKERSMLVRLAFLVRHSFRAQINSYDEHCSRDSHFREVM